MHWTNDPDHPLRRRYDSESWDVTRCKRELAAHLRQDHGDNIELTMHAMNELGCWRPCIAQFAQGQSLGHSVGAKLLAFWVTYGHYCIPLGLENDLPVFIDALRHHLPDYTGPAVTVYRGEVEARHKLQIYGISWTSDLEIATEFACNRETAKEGHGVVLRTEASPESIVAEPSMILCARPEFEYLIDPRLIQTVAVVS
jgi:hypothetical protein